MNTKSYRPETKAITLHRNKNSRFKQVFHMAHIGSILSQEFQVIYQNEAQEVQFTSQQTNIDLNVNTESYRLKTETMTDYMKIEFLDLSRYFTWHLQTQYFAKKIQVVYQNKAQEVSLYHNKWILI